MYGTSTLLSPLARRWRRFARLRRRLSQGALAVAALLLIAIPPSSEKIWHDVGLSVLVFAITLPVWRAPEEGLPALVHLRELHRRICWRVSAGLVLTGTLALIANRWLVHQHTPGDAADARTVATWGTVLACLSLAPLLAERPLWRLWPEPMRREAAVGEAMTKLSRARYVSRRPVVAGLPEPVEHTPAGPTSAAACATPMPRHPNRQHTMLRWDGHRLSVSDVQGASHPIPVAGREGEDQPRYDRRLRPVSEIVWVNHAVGDDNSDGTMLLIDTEGHRCGILTALPFRRNDAAWVARSAGVAFTVYDLTFAGISYEELMNALYPTRGSVFKLHG